MFYRGSSTEEGIRWVINQNMVLINQNATNFLNTSERDFQKSLFHLLQSSFAGRSEGSAEQHLGKGVSAAWDAAKPAGTAGLPGVPARRELSPLTAAWRREGTSGLSQLLWQIKPDTLPNLMCFNQFLPLMPNGSQMGSWLDCGGHLNVWAGRFEMPCHDSLVPLREQCQEGSGWWLERHLVSRIKLHLTQQISQHCSGVWTQGPTRHSATCNTPGIKSCCY